MKGSAGPGLASRAATVLLGVGAVAVLLVSLVHLVAPGSAANAWVSSRLLVAHALSFPLPLGLALVALAVVGLLGVAWRRRARPDGRARGAATAAWAATAVAGAVLAANAGTIGLALPREVADAGAASSAAAGPGSGASDEGLLLVEWNTLDRFDAVDAHRFFAQYHADVAVLPEFQEWETGGPGGSRMGDMIAAAGEDPADYDVVVSPSEGGIPPVTVVARRELGYRELTGADAPAQVRFGTVHLASERPGVPDVIGVHTVSPMPSRVPEWRQDLEVVAQVARGQGRDAVIAGDLNATLRTGALGGVVARSGTHADALTAVPPTRRGTWPAAAPAPVRSPIDHVLVPPSLAVARAEVLHGDRSDHSPVLVHLVPAG